MALHKDNTHEEVEEEIKEIKHKVSGAIDNTGFLPPTLKPRDRYTQQNPTQVNPVANKRTQPGLGDTSDLTRSLEEEVGE